MINQAFAQATKNLIRSTQIVYYTLNTPNIDNMSVIYRQGNDMQFECALTGFKKNTYLNNGDSILHHFNNFYDNKALEKVISITSIDINSKNNKGETALIHLSKICSKEDNKELQLDKELYKSSDYLEKFIMINEQIKSSSSKMCSIYIQKGCDVNHTDIMGCTALFYSINKGNIDFSLNIIKAPNFNPEIKFKQADYKDAFDLSLDHSNTDLSLAIFMSMTQKQRQDKISDLKDNLHINEQLLLSCKSLVINEFSEPRKIKKR